MNTIDARAARLAIERLVKLKAGVIVEFRYIENHCVVDLLKNGVERDEIASAVEGYVTPQLAQAIREKRADRMTLATLVAAEPSPPPAEVRCSAPGCSAVAELVVWGRPCCQAHRADMPMPDDPLGRAQLRRDP